MFVGRREPGWIEGQNLVIERRGAGGKAELVPGFAEEFVQLRPNVIVATGAVASLAAKNATTTIPFVTITGDPVRIGLVQAFLDGPGRADDGHIVVLAGPDGERYRHGALGDETEATRVLYLERHGLESLRSLTLPAPHVLGRRELDLAVWVGSVLLVPSQNRRQLRRFDAAAGWSERSGLALPAVVVATHPLRLDGHPGCALLLEGGSLAWASAPETAST